MNSAEFVGMSKKNAQNVAERKNLIFRLVQVNGEDYLGEPSDSREDRICVWLQNGVVARAEVR